MKKESKGGFRDFIHQEQDVDKILDKLPLQFKKLTDGYEIRFEIGNTLFGDKSHIGMIVNKPKKLIKISAPLFYSREFTLLHEIGHLVYESYIRNTDLEKEWHKLSLSTKPRKMDESSEELFCHSFASYFAKYAVPIHDHPEWRKFMDKVCKIKKSHTKID